MLRPVEATPELEVSGSLNGRSTNCLRLKLANEVKKRARLDGVLSGHDLRDPPLRDTKCRGKICLGRAAKRGAQLAQFVRRDGGVFSQRLARLLDMNH
jgi:hypothetical protein